MAKVSAIVQRPSEIELTSHSLQRCRCIPVLPQIFRESMLNFKHLNISVHTQETRGHRCVEFLPFFCPHRVWTLLHTKFGLTCVKLLGHGIRQVVLLQLNEPPWTFLQRMQLHTPPPLHTNTQVKQDSQLKVPRKEIRRLQVARCDVALYPATC